MAQTERSRQLWALLQRNGAEIDLILHRYGARNARVFGSVARGEATEDSDVDLIVDLDAKGADALWVLSGLSEDLRQLLGIRVDVVAADVLRDPVAASAAQSFIPLP